MENLKEMDFFEQQEKARRDTRLLLGYLFLAVLWVLAFTYILVAPFLIQMNYGRYVTHRNHWNPVANLFGNLMVFLFRPSAFFQQFWSLPLFFEVSAATLAVISLGTIWKVRQLMAGGGAVAELLEARPLAPDKDPDEQRLQDVVEEMAVASGGGAPAVYVLDDERGINAFAAGFKAEDMVIIVTRGCLRLLNRDEMQAVIAHEFGHIVNGDTVLKLRLTGWVHGILVLDTIGRTWTNRGDSEVDGWDIWQLPLVAVGGIFKVLGCPGLPFCRWIKSAICREREWLADAAAVQFTRNPTGLAGALKKIGGLPKKGRLDSPDAETISHLFFVSYTFEAWLPFLASHPPLVQRILAVEPDFDGQFPRVQMLPVTEKEREREFDKVVGALLTAATFKTGNLAGEEEKVAETIQGLADAPSQLGMNPHAIVQRPAGAVAVIYALLLNSGEKRSDSQYKYLQEKDPAGHSLALQVESAVAAMDERRKLALLDEALPALHRLKIDEYAAWMENVQELLRGGNEGSLFEFAVGEILWRVVPANGVALQEPSELQRDAETDRNSVPCCFRPSRTRRSANRRKPLPGAQPKWRGPQSR